MLAARGNHGHYDQPALNRGCIMIGRHRHSIGRRRHLLAQPLLLPPPRHAKLASRVEALRHRLPYSCSHLQRSCQSFIILRTVRHRGCRTRPFSSRANLYQRRSASTSPLRHRLPPAPPPFNRGHHLARPNGCTMSCRRWRLPQCGRLSARPSRDTPRDQRCSSRVQHPPQLVDGRSTARRRYGRRRRKHRIGPRSPRGRRPSAAAAARQKRTTRRHPRRRARSRRLRWWPCEGTLLRARRSMSRRR